MPIPFGTHHALALGMTTLRNLQYRYFVAILLLASAGAPTARAQAQAMPVGLIDATIHDLQNPSVAGRGDLPPWNPRKPFLRARINPFSILTGGVYAASWLDMTETQSFMPHFKEADPLAKPLLLLPKPLYYASGTLIATGVNWLGLRMERSPRWHKIWWLPQALSIAGNLSGYAYTRSNSSKITVSSTRAAGK
jgi:hypothetical protein